jgi:hypothetical protein
VQPKNRIPQATFFQQRLDVCVVEQVHVGETFILLSIISLRIEFKMIVLGAGALTGACDVRLLNKVKPTWVCTGRRLHIQSAFGSHLSRVQEKMQ